MGWDEISAARKWLSREQGNIVKDWGGRLPVALVYPNSYYLGMSSLGIHAIYRLLNSERNVVCERAFWEKEHRPQGGAPLSLELQRPLADFPVIAFSLTYELDYFHVVEILKASRVPLLAAERDARHPLVIAGGPSVTANPMPLAPFFDALCIGEAEPILPALLPVLVEGVGERRDRLLGALAALPGIFVPRCHEGAPVPVVRQWTKSLDEFPTTSVVLSRDTELGALYLIEVERGCNWGCRFCLVSNAFSPMRFRSLDCLLAQAKEGLKYRRRLGLVGPAVADHPQIEELVVGLRRMGAELAISSLRVKPLSPLVLGELAKGGAKTVVLAPEAGSERLRKTIGKNVSEADILAAVDQVARLEIKQLKLYFMIGLPTETDRDVVAIVDLVLKCKAAIEQRRSGTRLVLNVAPFIPKAGTPFARRPMAPVATLNRRLSLLKRGLPSKGVKVKTESPAWSEVQAVLSRGDAGVARVLAELPDASLASWRKTAEKCGLDVDFYAHREWEQTYELPWLIIK
jgi:radical SAM superfamily enzyme YgiQ (UPF0313 family)